MWQNFDIKHILQKTCKFCHRFKINHNDISLANTNLWFHYFNNVSTIIDGSIDMLISSTTTIISNFENMYGL